MAALVNPNPTFPLKIGMSTLATLDQYDKDFLARSLTEFRAHARRLNTVLANDGTETLQLQPFLKAALPAATPAGRMIYVTDEVGGAVPAFSDGTNWRRVQDRNVVS